MKYPTRINQLIQRTIANIIEKYPLLPSIVNDIKKAGGRSFLVGGAVRDMILEVPIKDIDIEIHGLSFDKIETILGLYGVVNYIGKSFGVLRLERISIDWSLPRLDASGRKPHVIIDPHLSIENAFIRRDLTINAMGIDLVSGDFIDPFNGLTDLKNCILRSPDPSFFIEDPLRFFRVMQFVGRLNMWPNEELNKLCRTMKLTNISQERIHNELYKLLIKSVRPSLGFRWVKELGRLHELFPELGCLVGLKQDAHWHPEGDVFEHTMQTLDAAARFIITNEYEKMIILLAALCHDLGKAKTTFVLEGKIRSLQHEKEGLPFTISLLKRITKIKSFKEPIKKLVRYHLMPGQLILQNSSAAAFKKLAFKLAPEVTMFMLALVAYADKYGRNAQASIPLDGKIEEINLFIERCKELNILHGIEKPILTGADLLTFIKPGPQIGKLLERAYLYQITQGISCKKKLINRIKQFMKNR